MTVVPQTAAAVVEGLARLGLRASHLGVPHVSGDADLALLWKRAIEHAGRRTVPVEAGMVLPLGAMGAVDYLAASSVTVGAALTIAQQLFPLVGPGVQLVIGEPRGGVRRVTIVDHPPFPGQAESDAFILGVLLSRLRLFASRPIDIPLVELTEPEPEPAARAPWQALLGAARMRFEARRATLHIRSDGWTVPLRSADPRLLSMLRAVVGVDQRSGDALLIAVRTLATQRLPGVLDLEYAAPALGMSRRTLQRKLAKNATALGSLVDEVRRDRAEELVAGGQLTFGEVAARLGFAEQASFTRAWRRWFGMTPSDWRTTQALPKSQSRRPGREQTALVAPHKAREKTQTRRPLRDTVRSSTKVNPLRR
jgi:AraC-like DNA-binding protein